MMSFGFISVLKVEILFDDKMAGFQGNAPVPAGKAPGYACTQ